MTRTRAAALILLLLSAAGFITLVSGSNRLYQTTAFLMDTFIEIRFYGWRAREAADRLLERLAALEAAVSPTMRGSDVVALGEAAGNGPIPVRDATFDLLEKSLRYTRAARGTFDLTIAPLTGLWDVASDHPRVPAPAEIAEKRALVDAGGLVLDAAGKTACLRRAGQGVDLGGVTKGEAAQLVFDTMEEFGIRNGYASLGGNMAVRGAHPGTGGDFVFGVRDPRGDASAYIGTIKLKGMTMATTGDYERFFEEDGARYHHVLDPRTGYPANGGLISVSVISRDGALADFLSTALFVAGKDAVLASCMTDPRYSVIAVDTQKRVYLSPALRDVFEPGADRPQYHFQFIEGEKERAP